MRARRGDRFRALDLNGTIRFTSVSSAHVDLGPGSLEVHYPCDGPYQVWLSLLIDPTYHTPEKVEAIRRRAFLLFGIPEAATWKMQVSVPPQMARSSEHRQEVALPTPARRLWGFVVGLGYLAMVSLILSQIIRQPFWAMFLIVFLGAVFICGLALWWLTLWARGQDRRQGQFRLRSLIFLTAFVALYFGAVRTVVTALPTASREGSAFLLVALFGIVPIAISIPFVLVVTDALLWTILWLKRRYPRRKPDR